tara:strand:+ start:176 stop:289 length:114 start_codon:yes stop_codon:yes gene_type:complete
MRKKIPQKPITPIFLEYIFKLLFKKKPKPKIDVAIVK